MVDQEDLFRRFKEKYEEMVKKNAVFLEGLRGELDPLTFCKLAEFSFPLDLWARAVYLAIDAFSAHEDLRVLDALRVLWQGRFLSLVRETKEMSDEEAESYIQRQLAAFERHRSMLNTR